MGNVTGGVALDALRTFLTVSFPISTVSPGEIRGAIVVAVGTPSARPERVTGF